MAEKLYPYALVDISDLKSDLGIDSETTWDGLLTRITNGVTYAIETMTKRQFVARTETLSLDGSGTAVMYVPGPIISIDSVTNNGTLLTVTTDYVWYAKTGKLVLVGVAGSSLLVNNSVWSTDPQSVVIDYRHGYDEQDMPQDILLAARTWAIHWFQRIRDDRMGVSSRSEGDLSISFRSEAMPPEVERLIQPRMRMGRTR